MLGQWGLPLQQLAPQAVRVSHPAEQLVVAADPALFPLVEVEEGEEHEEGGAQKEAAQHSRHHVGLHSSQLF